MELECQEEIVGQEGKEGGGEGIPA